MAVVEFLNRQIDSPGIEEVGIGGFRLLARVRETTDHKADAPITFLEDGSHVEDHIILNPIQIKIEGSVSDVFVDSEASADIVKRYLPPISLIGGYLPPRTATQLQKATSVALEINDKIRQADRAIKDGKQISSLFGSSSPVKNNPEKFIDVLDALYYGKQLITIDMPFRKYTQMLITARTIIRDNQQNALSFKVNARQIRFAETIFNPEALKSPSSGLNGQADGEENKGKQEGKDVERSLLTSAYEGISGLFGD